MMRIFVLLSLIFLTPNAFSCPDLKGEYQCYNTQTKGPVKISQSRWLGRTYYHIRGEVFENFRWLFKVPDTYRVGNRPTTVSCKNNEVIISSKFVNGDLVKLAQEVIRITKKSDKEVTINDEYISPDGERRIKVGTLCKKR